MIFWYKQTLDHGLTLLGYIWNKNNFPEENFKKKINLKGDGTKDGQLIIKDLLTNDSAVYYCAASLHSIVCSHNHNTKSSVCTTVAEFTTTDLLHQLRVLVEFPVNTCCCFCHKHSYVEYIK